MPNLLSYLAEVKFACLNGNIQQQDNLFGK